MNVHICMGPAIADGGGGGDDRSNTRTCGNGEVWDSRSQKCARAENGVLPDKALAANAFALAKTERYAEALAVPDRDALVLRYASGQRTRFAYFDIEAQTDVVLFELNPLTRPVATVVWTRYLFVTLGRDLLVYDLERRMVVGYENELIREGFLNNCCGVDRDGIVRLVLDEGRLIALTFDGTNSRVIDLPAYTAGLPARDFFLVPEGK